MYVTDSVALRALVESIRPSGVVAIDTEFMRERTYWPKLCLIQISDGRNEGIIDPLAFDDLDALWELLCDESVVKVLHAGSQDMEIFHQRMSCLPKPVFDTQIAATLAGFPQQVGYGAIVSDMLGVTLDKSDTYTDWSKRPLSDAQVEYALNDVRYLLDVYERLRSDLESQGRLSWLEPDLAKFADPATYEIVPDQLWRKVKRYKSLNRRQLAVLREVTAWREREAQRRDIPRRWVIGDESLIEVARRAPNDREALRGIRGVTDKLAKSSYGGLLDAVQAGVAVPDDELPEIHRRRRPVGDVEGAVDLMSALVRLRAREHGVALPLLASRDDLERLARGERDESPLMQGWRRAMVGNELVELLEGRVSLSADDGRLVVTTHEA